MNAGQLPPNPNKGRRYDPKALREIVLAGGCFWGTQAYVARLLGVALTECGYANGETENPTYEQVCTGRTGHAEAVRVGYDPAVIPLEELLRAYYDTINPTMRNRQGGDRGTQYRTGIYYQDDGDLPAIRRVTEEVQGRYPMPVVTELLPLRRFYRAEEYHQEYLEKHPGGYCHVDLSRLPGGEQGEGIRKSTALDG